MDFSNSNPKILSDMIDAEKARIEAKEQSYQNMEFGKQRVLELNQNFQERTTFFNWILFVFFFSIILSSTCFYLNTAYPDYELIFSVLGGLILVGGLGYDCYLYIDFLNRNPIKFDEIVYSPPTNATNMATDTEQVEDAAERCNAQPGMIWDISNSTCVTMDSYYGNYKCGNVIGSGNVQTGSGNVQIGSSSTFNFNSSSNSTFNEQGGTNDTTPSPTTTTPAPTTTPNPIDVPKLKADQIFLGKRKRNVVYVKNAKHIVFSILHKKNVHFVSNDNINFKTKDTDPKYSKLIATVVIDGPDGIMGQKINNQGIMITNTVNGKKKYYYRSKYPPKLLKGDVFLSDSGVMIEVIHHNEFHLKLTSTSDKYDVFQSNDGEFFKDVRNNDTIENNAKVIVHGPIGEDRNEIYGQGIRIHDVKNNKRYIFYFSENKNDESAYNSNVDMTMTTDTLFPTTPTIFTTTLEPIPTTTTTTLSPIPTTILEPTTTTETNEEAELENFETYSDNHLDKIPYIFINQYKVYPSLKSKGKNYQSAQKELPFVNYKNFK